MEQLKNSHSSDAVKRHSSHKVSKRAIMMAIALFACIVLGMFVFASLKKAEMNQNIAIYSNYTYTQV